MNILANPTIMSTTFITITAPQKNRNAIFGLPVYLKLKIKYNINFNDLK